MKPLTVSKAFPKAMPVICKRNDKLEDIDIKDSCFAVMIIYEGSARFEIDGKTFDADAPCFVCFDEHESPTLIKRKKLKCDSVYFDPVFINVNMTFHRIHSDSYSQIADVHDMFLLKPFTDREEYVFPLFYESVDSVKRLVDGVEHDLSEQTDWYWSCRSRSYFMELIFILERSYGCIGRLDELHSHGSVQSGHLQNAVIFIESHYGDKTTLSDIALSASINHTTLTRLFKSELNTTPMEYLWDHRIKVAKKQLEFTNLPIKDVAHRCGFSTVRHFCRKFSQSCGDTPAELRDTKLKNRIKELG